MPSSDGVDPLRVDPGFLAGLAAYVAIPSVSRDADAATMRRAADFVAAQLSFADARVVDTGGHPAVLGRWHGAPGAPTVLVYGHYDVQPTGNPAEWHTPPFELIVDGDVLRGRGVTDDKGPVFLVLTLARAMLARDGVLPLNITFLIEGEEEIGSPHLPDLVRAHADELAADLVISADGASWRPDVVSLSLGSKGLLGLTIEVTGATRDLHSGRYGGVVANPAHALAGILASLHTDDGAIAVPGFHDGMPPLPDRRRGQIAAVPFDDEVFFAAVGLRTGFGDPGYTTLERLWERPTLEINGLAAGGAYTVIPHVASAHVTCRLVPGQDPERVLESVTAHVRAQPAGGLSVRVTPEPGAVPAYTIPADHPAIEAARRALATEPGQEILLDVIAGTLPAATLFEDVLGAKTLFFSFSTSDENLHAPDEFIRTARLADGMRAWEQLWRLLAAGPHRLAPNPRGTTHRSDPA